MEQDNKDKNQAVQQPLENADQPPPTLSDGTSAKDKIISMISSFDAT